MASPPAAQRLTSALVMKQTVTDRSLPTWLRHDPGQAHAARPLPRSPWQRTVRSLTGQAGRAAERRSTDRQIRDPPDAVRPGASDKSLHRLGWLSVGDGRATLAVAGGGPPGADMFVVSATRGRVCSAPVSRLEDPTAWSPAVGPPDQPGEACRGRWGRLSMLPFSGVIGTV